MFFKRLNMSKKIVSASPVTIDDGMMTLISNAIKAEQKTYGARIAFAVGINNIAPADCVWYALEGNGQKLPPVIAAIKDAYYMGLKAINYSNPSNAWRMIKQYAKEDAVARAMFGEVAPAEGEASEAADTGDTKQARSPQLRLVEELTALHEYCAKMTAKNDPAFTDKHKAAHGHIVQALKALGVLEVTTVS
jgi:hypothetical protein